jgi:hypothetical protein
MANDKQEVLPPVTVDVLYRCSPFEGIRIFEQISVEYTTEKII